MAIKSIKDKKRLPIEIDLTGPDGNAFVLLGKATNLAKQLGLDGDKIVKEIINNLFSLLGTLYINGYFIDIKAFEK